MAVQNDHIKPKTVNFVKDETLLYSGRASLKTFRYPLNDQTRSSGPSFSVSKWNSLVHLPCEAISESSHPFQTGNLTGLRSRHGMCLA